MSNLKTEYWKKFRNENGHEYKYSSILFVSIVIMIFLLVLGFSTMSKQTEKEKFSKEVKKMSERKSNIDVDMLFYDDIKF